MLIKIVIGNLIHKLGATLISILLLTSGISIIVLVMTIQKQAETKIDNDLRDIDLVVGAKGSPLQLVLSSVYHIDAPTGNIRLSDAEKIIKNPMIEEAIPLAYGDSYEGYRIVGTDSSYIDKYRGKIAVGRLFKEPMEAVVGSLAASAINISVGKTFVGAHGLMKDDGHQHDEFVYKVTGILAPTHSALDNLILTPIESVWMVHDSHGNNAAHGKHDYGERTRENYGEKEDHHERPEIEEEHKELTSLLVRYRIPMAQLTLPRFINEQTNMQAVSPVLEMNRLMGLMGAGIATLKAIAGLLMAISGVSVFAALYGRLSERKYEMALMRSMGCSRMKLLLVVMLESLVICIASFFTGILLGALGVEYFSGKAYESYSMSITAMDIPFRELLVLFGVTMLIGLAAAMLPAVKAYYLNISKTLTNA